MKVYTVDFKNKKLIQKETVEIEPLRVRVESKILDPVYEAYVEQLDRLQELADEDVRA